MYKCSRQGVCPFNLKDGDTDMSVVSSQIVSVAPKWPKRSVIAGLNHKGNQSTIDYLCNTNIVKQKMYPVSFRSANRPDPGPDYKVSSVFDNSS